MKNTPKFPSFNEQCVQFMRCKNDIKIKKMLNHDIIFKVRYLFNFSAQNVVVWNVSGGISNSFVKGPGSVHKKEFSL